MKNMVLFWGWTRNDRSYKSLIDSTPKGWKVYTLNYEDLMKAGWIDKLEENVSQFLDKNNLGKIRLAGHSMGGALALEYAFQNPGRVKHLYLLDSSGVYGNENIPYLIDNFFTSQSVYGFDREETLIENLRAVYRIFKNPIAHLKLAYYAYRVDLQDKAKKIKVSTTLIWAANDKMTPLWQGKKLHKLIKGSKLIVLPKTGHNWPMYKPELFWENIKNG